MATVTSNPRRRLSRVPNAPTYANLASRYADTFQKALEAQESNDLNTKLNLFRLGQLDYATFKKYLEDKVKDAPAGSKKASDYTGLLVDAEKYNKQMVEETAKNTAERLRTELLEKIPGQVTTADELRILREIKKSVDPNSGVYADLVVEEAKLKNTMATEGAAGGKRGMQNNLDKYYAQISTENKNLIEDYKSGKITGYELDRRLYQNGLNFQDAVAQAEKAGVNVPTSYYQVAEDVNYIKQDLAQREVGQIFDVMNKSGEMEPVTHQELEADKLKTSPDFIRSKYEIQDANPALPGKIFNVIDTSTGEKINSFPVKASDAANLRKQMEDKNGYAVVVPKANENGVTTLQQYNYDPKTQSYSTPENPDQKIYSPVSTGFENRFATQPNKTVGDFINAGIEKVKSFFSPETNTVDYEKLNQSLYPEEGQMGPFMAPTILSAPTKKTTEESVTTSPDIAEVPQGPNFVERGVKAVKDFFGSAKPMPAQMNPPGDMNVPQGNLDIGGMNFSNSPFKLNLPSVNVPDVKVPEFNLNLGGFSSPSPSGFNSQSVSGPVMSPSSGGSFLDKLKSFGQSAIGSVKKIFGF